MKQFFMLLSGIFISGIIYSQCQTMATSQPSTSCNPCNGLAVCTAFGGTPPYTYLWAPSGGNQPTATGLCPGTYTITVTDAQGCVATATTTVSGMSTVFAFAQCTPALCSQLGSAMVQATGGTPPYTYNWSPSGQTSQTATGLGAGCYTVVVTDAGGCTATATCCVTVLNGPVITAMQVQPSSCPNCTGIAVANASGGQMPYTYSWLPTGGNQATASGLCQGVYSVCVTDAGGCTACATVTIGCLVGINDNTLDAEVSLFPNPASSEIGITLDHVLNGAEVTVYNILGDKISAQKMDFFPGQNQTLDIRALNTGIYFLEIRKFNATVKKKFVKD